MQEKIVLPNKKDLEYYEKYGIDTFLLPLENYSIGCNVYFSISEINSLSNKYKVYVFMNKFLHRTIYDFKELYKEFNDNVKFMVEDIGLSNIINKDKLVLYENHILSNYRAINFLYDRNIKNVTINNDLTINELEEISKKCKSNMYYFYVSKNMLMYSRRNLVKNYNNHFHAEDTDQYLLDEKVTHKVLEIKDEEYGSTVRYNHIFCASKYRSKLNKYNLVYDFSNIDSLNENMILENIDSESLCDLIDSDYYFLENDIKYKVGDLK